MSQTPNKSWSAEAEGTRRTRIRPGTVSSTGRGRLRTCPWLGCLQLRSAETEGGRGQEPRGVSTSGDPQRPPALRPAPQDRPRPRVQREPGAAARAGGHEPAGRGAALRVPGPPPARPPATPARLTRALQVVAGLHSGRPRRRSGRRRSCPGLARRTRLARASADTAQSSPTAGEGAGRGVRLPEGRPGAGASPNGAPGLRTVCGADVRADAPPRHGRRRVCEVGLTWQALRGGRSVGSGGPEETGGTLVVPLGPARETGSPRALRGFPRSSRGARRNGAARSGGRASGRAGERGLGLRRRDVRFSEPAVGLGAMDGSGPAPRSAVRFS